mgnify:CR=1 FL=1
MSLASYQVALLRDKKKIRKPHIDESKLLFELEEETKTTASKKPELMGAKLKALLKDEIEEYKKRSKTRAAEMIGIFSAHNYYASGFTPVELRTTLEDLGPTYVKIGQIMSSRPDLLPEEGGSVYLRLRTRGLCCYQARPFKSGKLRHGLFRQL